MMEAASISRSALDVEWQRLQVIAQNLANENTTRVGNGGPYRSVQLISGPAQSFAEMLTSLRNGERTAGVEVLSITEQATGVRRVRDPSHPHADADGFVEYPDLDRAAEMTLMIRTSRIYEANVTMLSIAQQMAMRALELGRR
jgi:flagellar basal-body rod protein FlgC